ncbi:uncharacterized protein MYCFIDRAFT_157523 [Pseudocercospora fijiensis CIRAD86]|uniref:EF-hand domain-containing protein n=1 Tax=Pseudocercospora fijiensis (strain CIRAD86) TaxID=383855 RepID=M3AMY2_PSEFD|nr:uncharacterized protein MYCFIDRAFT_157523 [Pseudocercospora fijiensis CIRAD86]EME78792.1 hypothetical protein MYCFIDRAFT_157523 [Pseudocercospora fijiensis CIRAD86]
MYLFSVGALAAGLIGSAQAHGNGNHAHEQAPIVDANADWATKHMAEEHHIQSFDAASFFNLHDYNSNNEWTVEDLMKTYGGMDKSTNHISQEDKEKAIQKVIEIFDRDKSGTISFAEYTMGEAQGLKLPDIGWGPGHHGDDEYEYEIHHFEKYHDENTKEEDLIHPEDIEHFRMHDEMEAAQEKQERMDKMAIIEANIPSKFRKDL